MLNQNLIHFSTKLILYVIIHEVCHLKEKNHQKTFWNLVEEFLPNWKSYRKQLKNIILEE